MRRLAEETRDVGAKTLQELDEQGDQLRKTNAELNEIDADLKAAEKTLTQVCSCCLPLEMWDDWPTLTTASLLKLNMTVDL
jgi:hypothetical protein